MCFLHKASNFVILEVVVEGIMDFHLTTEYIIFGRKGRVKHLCNLRIKEGLKDSWHESKMDVSE